MLNESAAVLEPMTDSQRQAVTDAEARKGALKIIAAPKKWLSPTIKGAGLKVPNRTAPVHLSPVDGAEGTMALLDQLEAAAQRAHRLIGLLAQVGREDLIIAAAEVFGAIFKPADAIGEAMGVEVNLD